MIIETYSEILKKKNSPGSFLEDQTSPQTLVYGGEESLKRGEESASLNYENYPLTKRVVL